MLKEEPGSRIRARRDTGRGISTRLRTTGRGQKAQANVKIGDALFAFSWCFSGVCISVLELAWVIVLLMFCAHCANILVIEVGSQWMNGI